MRYSRVRLCDVGYRAQVGKQLNPLSHMYGTNPVVVTDLRVCGLNLSLSSYVLPPSLMEIILSSSMTILERLHAESREMPATARVISLRT